MVRTRSCGTRSTRVYTCCSNHVKVAPIPLVRGKPRRMAIVENVIRQLDIQPPKRTYKKKAIPAAVRQQVWLKYVGEHFKSKCKVKWCRNTITVFQFDCGHNIPESKGGPTTLDNLLPICSNCNGSMRENYTIDEWNETFAPRKKSLMSMCFGQSTSADPKATSASVAPQK